MKIVDKERLEEEKDTARLLIARSMGKGDEICGVENAMGRLVCSDPECTVPCFQRRKEDNVSNGSGDRKV